MARLSTIAVSLTVVLTLSACAGSTPNSTGGNDASLAPALPAAEGVTDYPLTLDSSFGSTTLDDRPERIAVISPATVDTDALAALGVVPVLAPNTVELEPWTPDEIRDGVETFWVSEAGALPTAEEVAASEPDLIVALTPPETFSQDDFDRLSAFAPVLLPTEAEWPSWEEITTKLGEVLDLSEAASTVIDDVNADIDEIAERNPEFRNKSAAHVHVYAPEYGAVYFSYPGSDSQKLLERFGFTQPTNATNFSAENQEISDELVGMIDADVLLVTANPTPEGAAWFIDSTLFKTVPAVADGRWALYEPEPEAKFAAFAWAIRMQSPLSLPWAATTLEELAQEAIE